MIHMTFNFITIILFRRGGESDPSGSGENCPLNNDLRPALPPLFTLAPNPINFPSYSLIPIVSKHPSTPNLIPSAVL